MNHYHVKHNNDYKLIEFNKNNSDLIKIIKKYGYRNCKKNISRYWIKMSLTNCDIGYVYFHTEIIETKDNNNIIKTIKYRPCAFICLEIINIEHLHLHLVCSLTTNKDHLGTKLLNTIFEYSKNNGYKKISLDSISNKTTLYYSNKGFEIKEKPYEKNNKTTIFMVKLL